MRQRSGKTIIDVRDLVKRYGAVTAVDGITFSVDGGEIFGMLGPNGAGKTTTVEVMEGLRQADGGTVTVAGIDVSKEPYRVKEQIGVQLQATAFQPHLTCAEVIEMFAACYRRPIDPLVLLREVDLTEKAKALNETLSGGQRQRLSIATALVNEPQVLFLDEPTTGLDPQARRHLWDLVRRIRDRGTTVFLTTHYMDEAEILCDRVAIMDSGKIVAMSSPRALIGALLDRGFSKPVVQQQANLEDVFIDLTGHTLRED